MSNTLDAPPADSRPAKERVYLYVRDKILRGDFRGGSFIEEEQISSAVGVSRTPVREAFHRLEAEHFIKLLPRRGALVRQVTAQELVQVYETRRMVEIYVTERICQEGVKVPSEMVALLAEMEGLADPSDAYAHVALDRRFHRAMIASLGNDILTELYDYLRARQQLVAMTAVNVDPSRLVTINAEHRELLEALQKSDAPRARDALERHLQPVLTVVSRLPGYDA